MLGRLLVAVAVIVTAWLNPALSQTLSKEQPACDVPEVTADNWQIETPAKAGIDPQPLCALIEQLKGMYTNVHSVIVVRGGSLVFEHYRAGPDQKWGHLSDRSSMVLMSSMTFAPRARASSHCSLALRSTVS